MMKALIQLSNKQHNKELEIVDEPLFLKIAGKEEIGYYFDLFYQLGIKEVYIASDKNKFISQRLRAMNCLNLDIQFINSIDAQDTYVKNFELFCQEELLIIENLGFILNDFYKIDEDFFKNFGNCVFANNNFRVVYITQHSKDKRFDLGVKSMGNFKEYFFLSDLVLKTSIHKCFLLGYSNENGVILGKNVDIEKGCKLIPPVVIMDNVKVCKNTLVGPNTILNQNVFVSSNCEITNSIVYENTSLGSSLKLDNKLILSNIIVDKNNKRVYNIDTKFASANTMSLLTY